jgi:hypothetical protein
MLKPQRILALGLGTDVGMGSIITHPAADAGVGILQIPGAIAAIQNDADTWGNVASTRDVGGNAGLWQLSGVVVTDGGSSGQIYLYPTGGTAAMDSLRESDRDTYDLIVGAGAPR